jgi:hypothetical protein
VIKPDAWQCAGDSGGSAAQCFRHRSLHKLGTLAQDGTLQVTGLCALTAPDVFNADNGVDPLQGDDAQGLASLPQRAQNRISGAEGSRGFSGWTEPCENGTATLAGGARWITQADCR